jgi:hypothetical protein
MGYNNASGNLVGAFYNTNLIIAVFEILKYDYVANTG